MPVRVGTVFTVEYCTTSNTFPCRHVLSQPLFFLDAFTTDSLAPPIKIAQLNKGGHPTTVGALHRFIQLNKVPLSPC